MAVKHLILGLGAVAISATATAAVAAEAAPAKSVSAYAIGNRASTALKNKKKSHLQEVGDATTLSDGRYVIAGLGVIAVAGGIVVAVDKDDEADNDSAG